MAHPQIAVFARLAKENTPPTRVLAGQKTLLSRTMHGLAYDAVNDEVVVPSPFAQSILVFRGGANGEEAPIRVIQGPRTQLTNPDRLEVDPVHNEIFVPDSDKILVFPREGNGDVAPLRVIQGPDTLLNDVVKTLAVDPVHNLIVAGGPTDEGVDAFLLIFNRTDNGNVKPRAVIKGPKAGLAGKKRITQIQVYPPKGWIVATQPGEIGPLSPEGTFVGIWSINDNGDVPPRWKIGGPKSQLIKPRGIAIDSRNKELIIADMEQNAVFIFYFPEMF